MTSQPSSSASPVKATDAFEPASYCPIRTQTVELHDRGEDENEDKRFVLTDSHGLHHLAISDDERVVWEMMDGTATVDDICQAYLNRRRSLILNQIYSLIQRLWERGFLQNDPKIAATHTSQKQHWCKRLTPARLGARTLPGTSLILSALGKGVSALHLHSRPLLALQIIVIAFGGICFSNLTDYDYSILKISQSYEIPLIGIVPESYIAGMIVIGIIYFICSLMRHLYLGACQVSATKKPEFLVLEFNYFIIPCIRTTRRWLPILNRSARLAVSTSGIVFELLLAGLGALIIRYVGLTGLAVELLYKVTFVLYIRAFLHLSPFPASDFSWILASIGSLDNFVSRAIGFFRHSFIKALNGEIPLVVEHKLYLAYNVGSIFWLGLAATFGFELISANHYLIRNLIYVFRHSEDLTERLSYAGQTQIATEWAILAQERYVIAIVAGLFLLLVLGALCFSIVWIGYVAGKWMKSLPVWRNANALVAVGLLVIVSAVTLLHMFSQTGAGSAAVATSLLHFLTYAIIISGAVIMLFELDHLGRSRLATKFGALTLAMLLGAFALWLEADWVQYQVVITGFHAVATVLVVFSLAVGLWSSISLMTFRKTEFFVPELSVLMGSLVFVIGAFRALFAPPFHSLAVDHNRFVGSAMILLGMIVFLRRLRSMDLNLESLAIDMTKDRPDAALKRILAYVNEATARLISSKFGEQALSAIEERLNRGLESPEFTFASIHVDEEMPAEEIGKRYRERLINVRAVLVSMYGERFARRVFDVVFRRIHWECKLVLDQYIFPYSPWEDRYAGEQKLDGVERSRLFDNISMFRELAPNERQLLVRHSILVHYTPGELIARQGDYSDTCFVVAEGEVQVEETDSTGEVNILTFLTKGDFFGESAFLAHVPRMASVRATTPALMLALRRSDFDKFAQHYPEMVRRIQDRLRNLRSLLQIPLFGELSSNLLRSVLPRVRTQRFDTGDVIIKQGDMGADFYMIRAGSVNVVFESRGRQELICDLGPGDYFGEIALLKDVPRTATILTSCPTEVLILDKESFASLVKQSRFFAHRLETASTKRLRDQIK